MNGPAHYRAGEILADLEQRSYSGQTEISLGRQALTHARLANTAAAALGTSPAKSRAWADGARTKLSGT